MITANKFIIYLLHHCTSVRLYIGKSTTGIIRPRHHKYGINDKRLIHLPLYKWIRKLNNNGDSYDILVLEEVESANDLDEAEKFYISYFNSIGASLLNCTEGGEGTLGRKRTDDERKRIAISNLGKTLTPETRKKLSVLNAGKKPPPKTAEGIRKLSIANKGKIVSEETRRKIAIAKLGKKLSLQTRLRMSLSHRDNMSDERRANHARAASRLPRERFVEMARIRNSKNVPRIRINLLSDEEA